MGDGVMRVDEVAAHNLLLALGLNASDANLRVAADHLAAHRVAAERFLLDKARADLLAHLESAFMRVRVDEGSWSDGYGAAEHEALAWLAMRSHASAPPRASTKGRILRSMIRARKRDAHDGRNYP